jgi:hypothetical protein
VAENLPANNYLLLHGSVQPFAMAVKLGRMQLGIGWRLPTFTYLSYSNRLAQLLWYGNGPFVGETLELGPDALSATYHEAYLHASLPIGDKIRIGGRLKQLSGIASLQVAENGFSLYTDPEYYQVEIQTAYQVNLSTNFFLPTNLGDLRNPQNWQLDNNRGMAFDLGLRYQFLEKWELGVSLLDVGFINWDAESTVSIRSEGSFRFEGLPFEFFEGNEDFSLEQLGDSVIQTFAPDTLYQSFRTTLPRNLLIGLSWQPLRFVRVGALYREVQVKGERISSVSAHASVFWRDRLMAGLTYTYQPLFPDQLGLQFTGKLGPLQVFACSQNVLGAIRFQEAQTADFRVGVNLVFGKAYWKKRKKK